MPKSYNSQHDPEHLDPLPTMGASAYMERVEGNRLEQTIVDDEKRLYAIFSGLQGSVGAVRLAARVIGDRLPGQQEAIAWERIDLALWEALRQAHTSILAKWSYVQEPVGTAAAVLYFFEELNGETQVAIGTSGDCHVYCLTRENGLRHLDLLSRDQAVRLETNRYLTDQERRDQLAQHLRARKLRSLREEAYGSRAALYGALGVFNQGPVVHGVIPVNPGDEFLLCTAGVHQSLDTSDLLRALGHGSGPRDDAMQVVRTANQRIRDLGAAGTFLRYLDRTALSVHVGDR